MRPAGKARRPSISGICKGGATPPDPGVPAARFPARWGGDGMQRRPNANELRRRDTIVRPILRSGCWRSRTSGAGCGPARYARRPARTASFIASAIATGSCAPAIAVFISTRVGAELHRQRRVRRRADAGVDDERHAGELADDAQVVRVLDAEPGADRRAERHDRRGAGVFELAADDRIVGRVRQHDEAFAHEDARRVDQLLVVGEERPLVADHFELHPVRQPGFAARAGRCGPLRRRCSSRRCSAAGSTSTCRCSRAAIPWSDRRCSRAARRR